MCPVGPYLDGKTFEEICQILVDPNSTLPVCVDENSNPDEECLHIVHRTFVGKDFDSIANISLVSHNKIIDLHTQKKHQKVKNYCGKMKNLFDSAQACYDFKDNCREKVTHTILKVHKDCETAGTDRAKIKFHHLKIYDKQGFFYTVEIQVRLRV